MQYLYIETEEASWTKTEQMFAMVVSASIGKEESFLSSVHSFMVLWKIVHSENFHPLRPILEKSMNLKICPLSNELSVSGQFRWFLVKGWILTFLVEIILIPMPEGWIVTVRMTLDNRPYCQDSSGAASIGWTLRKWTYLQELLFLKQLSVWDDWQLLWKFWTSSS